MTILPALIYTCSMTFSKNKPRAEYGCTPKNGGIASNFFRFSRFWQFEVFKHNIRHTYVFAKNGIIILPQENSYLGMAVSRGTLCCNVQDLFHFLGIGCARGFQKIANIWQTIMKMVASPSERVPRSSGFEILKREG